MLLWIKRTWLVAVLVFLCVFFWQEKAIFSMLTEHNHSLWLIAATTCIFLGKLVCIDLVHSSLLMQNQRHHYFNSAYWYGSADIAKYIPGGIWPIVGRLAMYKQHMPKTTALRAFVLETGVIIGVPLAIGIGFILPCPAAISVGVSLGLLLLGTGLCVILSKQNLPPADTAHLWLLAARAVAGQLLCWLLFFPLSLYLLTDGFSYFKITGSFDLAFAIGQLAVFAPSGIGVREWVFDIFFNAENQALIIATLLFHRLLWAVADISLFFIVNFSKKLGTHNI